MKKYLSHFENGGGRDSNQWGFPKGRKHFYESKIACAMREFEEETTIKTRFLKLADLPPLEEVYVGTDDKMYQSVYYLAYIDHFPDIQVKYTNDNIRKTRISDEVSQLGWFSYGSAYDRLNRDKKAILRKVNNFLLHNDKKRTFRHRTF